MKQHIEILELAATNQLPEKIDRTSALSIQVARELVDAGYLTAISANTLEGFAVISPAITLAGRQFLEEKRKKQGFGGFIRRLNPMLKWAIGIVTTLLTAWLIKVFVGNK